MESKVLVWMVKENQNEFVAETNTNCYIAAEGNQHFAIHFVGSTQREMCCAQKNKDEGEQCNQRNPFFIFESPIHATSLALKLCAKQYKLSTIEINTLWEN